MLLLTRTHHAARPLTSAPLTNLRTSTCKCAYWTRRHLSLRASKDDDMARASPRAMPSVAVVGGGVAGALCAHLLCQRGASVTVMDMGKQVPGGRSSTRRAVSGGVQYQFDHGAQFFRASSPAMQQLVRQWMDAGVVAEWKPRAGVYDVASGAWRPREELGAEEAARHGNGFFGSLLPSSPSAAGGGGGGPMYVGTPSMDAVVAHLLGSGGPSGVSGDLHLRQNTRVHKARYADGRWWLEGERVHVGSNGGVDPGLPPPVHPAPLGTAGPGAGAAVGAVANGGGTVVGAAGAVGGATQWNLGAFDALVITDCNAVRHGSPGYISLEGGSSALSALRQKLTALPRQPLFALSVGWAQGAAGPLLPGDAVTVAGGNAIDFVVNDSSKPGRERRDGISCWVAITRPDYARRIVGGGPGPGGLPPSGPEYQAKKAQEIWTAMQADLRVAMGIRPLNRPKYLSAHRWGSAYVTQPLGVPAVWEAEGRWAACGDFCLGPGVEHAATSGAAAAEAVAGMLGLGAPKGAAAAAAGGGAGGAAAARR